MATWLPGFSGAFGSISIRCSPPGLSTRGVVGLSRSSCSMRIWFTPPTMRDSCSMTLP